MFDVVASKAYQIVGNKKLQWKNITTEHTFTKVKQFKRPKNKYQTRWLAFMCKIPGTFHIITDYY